MDHFDLRSTSIVGSSSPALLLAACMAAITSAAQAGEPDLAQAVRHLQSGTVAERARAIEVLNKATYGHLDYPTYYPETGYGIEKHFQEWQKLRTTLLSEVERLLSLAMEKEDDRACTALYVLAAMGAEPSIKPAQLWEEFGRPALSVRRRFALFYALLACEPFDKPVMERVFKILKSIPQQEVALFLGALSSKGDDWDSPKKWTDCITPLSCDEDTVSVIRTLERFRWAAGSLQLSIVHLGRWRTDLPHLQRVACDRTEPSDLRAFALSILCEFDDRLGIPLDGAALKKINSDDQEVIRWLGRRFVVMRDQRLERTDEIVAAINQFPEFNEQTSEFSRSDLEQWLTWGLDPVWSKAIDTEEERRLEKRLMDLFLFGMKHGNLGQRHAMVFGWVGILQKRPCAPAIQEMWIKVMLQVAETETDPELRTKLRSIEKAP